MFTAIWQYQAGVLIALTMAAALFAWQRGAGPERACAGVLAAMVLEGLLTRFTGSMPLTEGQIDGGQLLTDLAATGGLALVALRANRLYPLALAALHLVVLSAHLVRGLSPGLAAEAHAIMSGVPRWLEVLVLIAGIAAHRRRLRRIGPYRNWRLVEIPGAQ